MTDLTSSFGPVKRSKQTGSFVSQYLLPYFFSQLYRRTMMSSIAKRLIDNFDRIIKRRTTKSRSCALSCLLYGTREAATRRLILSRRERWSAAHRRVEKGEKERDRPNEWRGIDTRNIGYTTEYASTILLSPFCPLLFIPTLLPRPTWSTGLRTACVHARINKRSIHYL